MATETLYSYSIILLPILITAWIGIRIYEVRAKQAKIDEAYDKFKETIWPFMHVILSDGCNLNVELIQHFPDQKNAAREYIQNMKGKKKKEFIKLWEEYESMYDEVKSLGVFAPAVAIAPSEKDLAKNTNVEEMIGWEIERINKLSKLLSKLLKTAKIKIWF